VERARKGDANDRLYQLEASMDYDPSEDLERIKAPLLAINFADDELNPPELGVLEAAAKRVSRMRHVLVAAGPPHHLARGALEIAPGRLPGRVACARKMNDQDICVPSSGGARLISIRACSRPHPAARSFPGEGTVNFAAGVAPAG
jgi:hypothetical protein